MPGLPSRAALFLVAPRCAGRSTLRSCSGLRPYWGLGRGLAAVSVTALAVMLAGCGDAAPWTPAVQTDPAAKVAPSVPEAGDAAMAASSAERVLRHPATPDLPPRKPDPAVQSDGGGMAPKVPESPEMGAQVPTVPDQGAVLRTASILPTAAAVARLPTDPAAVARLRTRPPTLPPVDSVSEPGPRVVSDSGPGPGEGATIDTANAAHCLEAVHAARTAVNRYLDLPPQDIPSTEWVEEALRVTEVAARTCRDQPGEEAATYWRATALFLHGQYARAAINFRRVADLQGPFNALGYAGNLAALLQTCGDDRAGLDAFRLGGLYEAAGNVARAAAYYQDATASPCAALREAAGSRLRLIAEPPAPAPPSTPAEPG